MSQLLTLSRAARLVGVTRGALQKKIKNGELTTFEGKVSPADLLRVYPQAHLEDNTVLERMTFIRDTSVATRFREHSLPNTEILAARLTELSKEYADTRVLLEKYRTVVDQLNEKFGELEKVSGSQLQSATGSIRSWLRNELEKGLLNTDHYHPLFIKDSFLRIMVAHVHILPSKHEFFVEGNDTILDAALRAGLALDYGCSNGNCGLCKAKIISGQVMKTRHHDYVISEAEKGMGYVLLCSSTAVTDLVIEAPEAGGVRDIPLQNISAKVKRLERLSDDMLLLHLQTPRTNRLRFLAGQDVTLQAGNDMTEDFPVASCPCDDRNIEFHIRKEPGNRFSDFVFNTLKRSDVVSIEGPKGDFVLREDSHRPLIFIACDIGFAPIKSLVEHAMALNAAESIHLYWIALQKGNHYLHNLCRSWADALDNFHYTPLAIEHGASEAVDKDSITELMLRVADDHPALNEFDVYVAGPEAVVTAVEFLLLDRGLPESQLFLEHIN